MLHLKKGRNMVIDNKCKYYRESIKASYSDVPARCAGTSGNAKCNCGGDKSKCEFTLAQSAEESMLTESKELGEWIWQGLWLTFPLNPWFNDTTKQVYKRNIFEMMIKTNTTFADFKKMLENYIRARNLYFGVQCCNKECFLTRENKRFEFGIYDSEFHLWDDFSQALGGFKVDINKVPSQKFIDWIENITKEYCESIVHCSDCDKTIKKDEIAGRYFAGIYCSDCWNRKWKAVEAKETYN